MDIRITTFLLMLAFSMILIPFLLDPADYNSYKEPIHSCILLVLFPFSPIIMLIIISIYGFWKRDDYDNSYYGIVCSFGFASFFSLIIILFIIFIGSGIKIWNLPADEQMENLQPAADYLNFIFLEFGAILFGLILFCIIIGPCFYLGEYLISSLRTKFEKQIPIMRSNKLYVRPDTQISNHDTAVNSKKLSLDITVDSSDIQIDKEAKVYATTRMIPGAPIITRTFALIADPEDIYRIGNYFTVFRTIENTMTQHMFSQLGTSGFEQRFKSAGNVAYKTVYDDLNLKGLPFQFSPSYRIKERLARAASYYPYFAMRNLCIRKYNLSKMISFLLGLTTSSPHELRLFLKRGEVSRSSIKTIQGLLTRDIYGQNQFLNTVFIKNHLAQLRNLLLNSTPPHPAVGAAIQNLKNDPIQLRKLVGTVLQGFTRTKKKKTIPIRQNALSDYIKGVYFSTVKRRTSKIYRMNLTRKSVRTIQPLDQFVTSIHAIDLMDFKNQRDVKLGVVRSSIIPYSNLITLTWNIVKNVINEYSAAPDPIYPLVCPRFARIPIQSIDQAGFEAYLAKKIEYKVKELFLQSVPQLNTSLQQALTQKLTHLQNNLPVLLRSPEFKKKTIHFPFVEQLWDVSPKYYPLNPTHLQSILFGFTPEVRGQKSDFVFGLPASNLNRLANFGMRYIETAFALPPTLCLEGRKLLLHQPFQPNVTGLSPLNSDIEMGIDLGLKDFAVLSIRDARTGKELRRYFLDQKAVFGMKFNELTGKFTPIQPKTMINKKTGVIRLVPGNNYNIERKLLNLRSEINDTQSEYDLCPTQYPKDNKRLYHLKRSLDCLWKQQNDIHLEIVHQVSHKIVQIAAFNHVGTIKFEDLRWSRHGKKQNVGWWLSQNQAHWLHGKIVDHTAQAAKRIGCVVGEVDAKWTSQICPKATIQNPTVQNIRYNTQRATIAQFIGSRRGKTFTCQGTSHGGHRHELDADLAAARNVSWRPIVHYL